MILEILCIVFLVLSLACGGGTFAYPQNNGIRGGAFIFLVIAVACLAASVYGLSNR
jgi:hypothetical protein